MLPSCSWLLSSPSGWSEEGKGWMLEVDVQFIKGKSLICMALQSVKPADSVAGVHGKELDLMYLDFF